MDGPSSVEPRRRGRPPKPPGAALSALVTVRLTATEAAILDRVAMRNRVSVAAVLRQIVRRATSPNSRIQ